MKLVLPVYSAREAEVLAKEGVDEFYCGFMPENQKPLSYGQYSLNRRFTTLQNIVSEDELKEAVNISHSSGIPLGLAVNSFYGDRELKMALEQVEIANRLGIDYLIICDMGLLYLFNQKQLEWKRGLHLSLQGNSFNAESIDYCHKLGVTRVILPRQLSPDEIVELSSGSPCELELLIMKDRCQFIDGFCGFMHSYKYGRMFKIIEKFKLQKYFIPASLHVMKGLRRNFTRNLIGCLLKYEIRDENNTRDKESESVYYQYENFDTCGACILSLLSKSGVGYLKVARAGIGTDEKLRIAGFLKSSISLLDSLPAGEFQSSVKNLYLKYYGVKCSDSNCYYPTACSG